MQHCPIGYTTKPYQWKDAELYAYCCRQIASAMFESNNSMHCKCWITRRHKWQQWHTYNARRWYLIREQKGAWMCNQICCVTLAGKHIPSFVLHDSRSKTCTIVNIGMFMFVSLVFVIILTINCFANSAKWRN